MWISVRASQVAARVLCLVLALQLKNDTDGGEKVQRKTTETAVDKANGVGSGLTVMFHNVEKTVSSGSELHQEGLGLGIGKCSGDNRAPAQGSWGCDESPWLEDLKMQLGWDPIHLILFPFPTDGEVPPCLGCAPILCTSYGSLHVEMTF